MLTSTQHRSRTLLSLEQVLLVKAICSGLSGLLLLPHSVSLWLSRGGEGRVRRPLLHRCGNWNRDEEEGRLKWRWVFLQGWLLVFCHHSSKVERRHLFDDQIVKRKSTLWQHGLSAESKLANLRSYFSSTEPKIKEWLMPLKHESCILLLWYCEVHIWSSSHFLAYNF
jgi:hypothetical protein